MNQIIFMLKGLYTRCLFLFFVFGISYQMQAQFFPYNPYIPPNSYNQGYALGQQIGSAIQRNTKYGRNQFRKAIKKWGECKNGTLSLEHGAVALYSGNGYFCSAAVDDRISAKLKSINNSGGTINDVNIAENGNFIIVYNDKEWYGVLPSALNSALGEYSYGTKFKSISFNESGTYAITTSDGFRSNNAQYQSFYDDNIGEYGELLSVNISGEGAVFCYSNGTKYCGRIPDIVETAIRSFSHTANFVKFNRHGDYLICDKYGSYSYSIGDADAGGNASTVYYDWSKERIKRAKEKAYAKWDGKAKYMFSDKKNVHRVWCEIESIEGKLVSLETTITTNYNAAPTLNIDFHYISETDYGGILGNLSDEGLENMSLEFEMENGETITSNEMAIYKSWLGLGIRLSTSLVSMRSNNRSLRGDISSIQYLVGQFSTSNIKSITFKGRYTVDFSSIDTKSQMCYNFFRLADESGKSNILPN